MGSGVHPLLGIASLGLAFGDIGDTFMGGRFFATVRSRAVADSTVATPAVIGVSLRIEVRR
ncbi:hypothetical protein GCM10022382_31460 [Microbacterium invictum]